MPPDRDPSPVRASPSSRPTRRRTGFAGSVHRQRLARRPARPAAAPTDAGRDRRPPRRRSPHPTPTTPSTAKHVLRVNPLTGVGPVPAAPLIAVKIDDTAPGRPQVNIDKADIVYIEAVEGGLTRLAALFGTPQAGRSATCAAPDPSDPDLLPPVRQDHRGLLRRRARLAAAGAPLRPQELEQRRRRAVLPPRLPGRVQLHQPGAEPAPRGPPHPHPAPPGHALGVRQGDGLPHPARLRHPHRGHRLLPVGHARRVQVRPQDCTSTCATSTACASAPPTAGWSRPAT